MPSCANCFNNANCRPAACFCSFFNNVCGKLYRFITCCKELGLADHEITNCWNFSIAQVPTILDDVAPFKDFLVQEDFPGFVGKFYCTKVPLMVEFYNNLFKQGLCKTCFDKHFGAQCECDLKQCSHQPTDFPVCFYCNHEWSREKIPLNAPQDRFLTELVDKFMANLFDIIKAKNAFEIILYCDVKNLFFLKQNSPTWQFVQYAPPPKYKNSDEKFENDEYEQIRELKFVCKNSPQYIIEIEKHGKRLMLRRKLPGPVLPDLHTLIKPIKTNESFLCDLLNSFGQTSSIDDQEPPPESEAKTLNYPTILKYYDINLSEHGKYLLQPTKNFDVKCKYCPARIRASVKITSNWITHLKRFHNVAYQDYTAKKTRRVRSAEPPTLMPA